MEPETPHLQHGASLGPRLALAMQAAAAAGKVVRDNAGRLDLVEQKDVGDLVSQVDLDADAAAQAILQRNSDLPILSEELSSQRPEEDSFWILDPLDASGAYLMQVGPQYPSVLLALREGDQTTLAVTYFPLTDEWFYAKRGRGAWFNGKRLVCDSEEHLGDVWVEMNQYGNADWESGFFSRLRKRLRSDQGALMMTCNAAYSGVAARIATGRGFLAAAVHDNNRRSVKQAPWDIAAPQLILEEAGGVFVNPQGDRIDPFRAEPIVVARSASLARQIIELAAKQMVG